MSSYIGDGYTREDGFIEGALPDESGERLFEALEFVYRPATRMEVVELDANIRVALRNQDIDPKAAVKAEKLSCEFVASHVKSWNLKNAVHDVDVSALACERMNGYLFGNLYSIIRGLRTSDKKPTGEEPKPSDADSVKN